MNRAPPPLALLLLLVLAALLYWPGLQGGFLFDDFPNLEPMGRNGEVRDWASLLSFIQTGFSGPTGRPLSLLSFTLDDWTWPSTPYAFKRTNLFIHLAVGCVLCWTQLKLLQSLGRPATEASWIALLGSAVWLLHPYFASTTLYVVQRMAQLSTLFVLSGLCAYLHGRMLLTKKPQIAYCWMTAGIGLGTLFGILSKENGALLPLLALSIEWVLRTQSELNRPARIWTIIFLLLPSTAVIAYLALQVNLSPTPWPTRNFNQIERLLTQPRVILDYISQLWLPRIEGHGLFQDGIELSRDAFSPTSTLPSIIGIGALLTIAVFNRYKWPLWSIATLFFLTGHLLESTILGLEIHFEHRNYLPATLMFLPVADTLIRYDKISFRVRISIAISVLALLSFLLSERAQLWSNTDQLQDYWAAENISSPRAHNHIARKLIESGQIAESINYLRTATHQNPESALLSLRLLIHQIAMQEATPADFRQTAERLAGAGFDAQAVEALALLSDIIINRQPSDINLEGLREILDALDRHERYRNLRTYLRLSSYIRGRLALTVGDPATATQHFSRSMLLYADTDSALQMVSEMAQSGHFTNAADLLQQANGVFRLQPKNDLKRPPHIYEMEFNRLREALESDIDQHAPPSYLEKDRWPPP